MLLNFAKNCSKVFLYTQFYVLYIKKYTYNIHSVDRNIPLNIHTCPSGCIFLRSNTFRHRCPPHSACPGNLGGNCTPPVMCSCLHSYTAGNTTQCDSTAPCSPRDIGKSSRGCTIPDQRISCRIQDLDLMENVIMCKMLLDDTTKGINSA